MAEDKALEILKAAILLERRGRAFYEQVASSSKSPAVTKFFALMAEEEARHIEVISREFASYTEHGRFCAKEEAGVGGPGSGPLEGPVAQVLVGEIRGQIAAAGYEAAAISAAIELEKRAVKVYTDRAAASGDPSEQGLYQWLAQWERGHLRFLAEINEALTEEIWYQNNFWPF